MWGVIYGSYYKTN